MILTPSGKAAPNPAASVDQPIRGLLSRLGDHIVKLEVLRASSRGLDRGMRITAAITLLGELCQDLTSISSGETQQTASDLRAVAAAESAADATSPLLVLGQGEYRREVCGNPKTGELLDVRA